MASILIVDDEKDLADLLGAVLQIEGHNVECAMNGREALEKRRLSDFDLALIDIKLPDMNGVQVFMELKKQSPKMQAIMMTGFSLEDMIEKALTEGAYTCIHKPFDPEMVIELVKKMVSSQKRVILAVDDEAEIREHLKEILSREGYEVLTAEDGERALTILKRESVRVLLVNFALPDLDGLKLFIEAQKLNKDMVGLLITGYELSDILKRREASLLYGWMKKPIDSDRLIMLVNEAFDKR
jgi:DNA-binding NtrC family response regulator